MQQSLADAGRGSVTVAGARGAWLFPGQGNQYPGMLHDVRAVPGAEDVLAVARNVLEEDLLGRRFERSAHETREAQLGLLLMGVICARDLLGRGVEPTYLAGHSLGAWTAAVVTGSLDLADAVRLVNLRGTLMAAANPPGFGLAAVVGLATSTVQGIADEVRAAGGMAWASNRNTPDQSVVSGAVTDLERILQRCAEAGATKAVMLNVAVAAHSPLMQPVADALHRELATVPMARPRWPVAGNVTGRTLRTADQLREDLAAATAAPVAWSDALATLRERGVQYWLQVRPGHDLVGMVARQWPDDRAWCLDNVPAAETAARIERIPPAG